MTVREQGTIFGTVLAWAIGGAVIVLVVAFIFQWSALPFVNKQTQINRASNGYITAQQEALENDMVAYQTAETHRVNAAPADKAVYESQEAAIIHQMKVSVSKIPGNVPNDIAVFLENK